MNNMYILFVLTNHMEKVKRELNKIEGLAAFIPMKEKIYRVDGKVEKVKEILFPGYIFVQTEMDQATFNEKIYNCKSQGIGIIKELSYRGQSIEALKEDEKRFIEKLLGSNHIIKQSIGMIENDKVIIMEGPLIGLESSIIKIDRHKRLATIQVQMFGEIKEVKVSLEILSKT